VQYVSRDLPLLHREAWFRRNNIEATANLCRRYAGGPVHLVNIGTSMMYRQDGRPIYRIGDPMQGQGVYSRSKIEAQALVDGAALRAATVVPCIIGGPGREGLFRQFVASMVRLGLVAIPGRGRHPIHMVHVWDVADLVVRILQQGALGLFNAAGPEPLSIHQWIDEIEAALGLPPVRRLQLPLAPIALLSRTSAYRLLASEQLLMLGQSHVLGVDESTALGWSPRYSNRVIVRDIAVHLRGETKTRQ
jgi:nucleoside-diphosphate-sugar epimerase